MKNFRAILIAVILVLIVLRLSLPYILLPYIERKINSIPEYRVKIADLSMDLYRGAYSLKGIKLLKINKNIPVPFYEARTMDFSIEWAALLHGSLVAKITVLDPNVNFVTDPKHNNEQLTISKQWIDVVKSLYPLNINRLDAHNGKISFISYTGDPPFEIYVKNAEFTLENMQKTVKAEQSIASSFSFKADVIGGGSVSIEGKFDPLKSQPTFQIKTILNSLQVVKIANFLKHYSKIDVAGGVFSLYGESVAANGKVKGYIKPFIKNLKIAPPKNNHSPITAIVDGAAAVVAKILENPQKKTIATKIKISGEVDDPDTSILSIIGYLIRHGFIQALLPQIDNSIKMQDIQIGKRSNSKEHFPSYH